MRILVHSSTPECHSGYGNQVRELARRIRGAGHFVRVGTKHPTQPWRTWEGIEIFEGTNRILVNQMLKDEAFDYILTMWDIWLMQDHFFPREKWVAWVPIDTDRASAQLLEVTKRAGRHIAMSEHGREELERCGLSPAFAPCGVDMGQYRIKPEGRKAFRDDFGMDDETFVVGSVGMNYGDDRKGFIPLMQAFKLFLDFYPKSALYIHTHALGAYPGTIHYRNIADYLGISHRVCWPHQLSNDIGRIDPEWLTDIYNGMDVLCLPTKGEGFGIPLVEAQMCGTPVVVTATTTGPELCRSGHRIRVDEDDLRWLGTGTFRHEPRPSEILRALKFAWEDWMSGLRGRASVRERVVRYDWNIIWPTFWVPILEELESGPFRAVPVDPAQHGVGDVVPAQ